MQVGLRLCWLHTTKSGFFVWRPILFIHVGWWEPKFVKFLICHSEHMLLVLKRTISFSGGSRGGSGGSLEPPSLPPFLNILQCKKMKLFGLNETKLFYFHGMFKKNEIKSANPTLLYIWNPFPEMLDPPCNWDGSFEHTQYMFWLRNKKINIEVSPFIWKPACWNTVWRMCISLKLTKLNLCLYVCVWV